MRRGWGLPATAEVACSGGHLDKSKTQAAGGTFLDFAVFPGVAVAWPGYGDMEPLLDLRRDRATVLSARVVLRWLANMGFAVSILVVGRVRE